MWNLWNLRNRPLGFNPNSISRLPLISWTNYKLQPRKKANLPMKSSTRWKNVWIKKLPVFFLWKTKRKGWKICFKNSKAKPTLSPKGLPVSLRREWWLLLKLKILQKGRARMMISFKKRETLWKVSKRIKKSRKKKRKPWCKRCWTNGRDSKNSEPLKKKKYQTWIRKKNLTRPLSSNLSNSWRSKNKWKNEKKRKERRIWLSWRRWKMSKARI